MKPYRLEKGWNCYVITAPWDSQVMTFNADEKEHASAVVELLNEAFTKGQLRKPGL